MNIHNDDWTNEVDHDRVRSINIEQIKKETTDLCQWVKLKYNGKSIYILDDIDTYLPEINKLAPYTYQMTETLVQMIYSSGGTIEQKMLDTLLSTCEAMQHTRDSDELKTQFKNQSIRLGTVLRDRFINPGSGSGK